MLGYTFLGLATGFAWFAAARTGRLGYRLTGNLRAAISGLIVALGVIERMPDAVFAVKHGVLSGLLVTWISLALVGTLLYRWARGRSDLLGEAVLAVLILTVVFPDATNALFTPALQFLAVYGVALLFLFLGLRYIRRRVRSY